MTTTAEQSRTYRGPAILSFGFRPFFLGGAIWAVVAIAAWIPVLAGSLVLPSAFTPVEWHMHELLFGYVPAVVAGFLLTAIPNWTGRLPVTGRPLAMLFVFWIAGRIAVLFSTVVGPLTAAVIDLAFLVALAAIIAREVIAGTNTRNFKVLAIVLLLLAANLTFHIEANLGTGGSYGMRSGIAAIILLITLIGGRIVPSFTRNWLARQPDGRMPVAFNKFDIAAMVAGGAALASWCAMPEHALTITLTAAAAVLHTIRLARWAGERTLAEPLVLILHVAYAFVPIGFALVALAGLGVELLSPSGAIHAWTSGAIGLMTLAVMTRASLGHAGRAMTATPAIRMIYGLAVIAAVTRLIAAFGIEYSVMLHISALSWVLAFGGFVVVYWPMLTQARNR